MEVSEEEEVAHRRSGRSVLARTSGQVIGTATSTTAAPTTLLAAQTASSVVLPRMILLAAVGDTRVTCLELEVSGLAAAAAAPAAPTGNPVTGFALGLVATSTILLAGWNVSDAMHRGTQVASLHIHPRISILADAAFQGENRRL